MKKVKWDWEYGVYTPLCPYCNEPAYEKDHCVFCNQKYKWVEGKHKFTEVVDGDYTIVQSTNGHIHIIKDGRMVMHINQTEKKTEQELLGMLDFYRELQMIGEKE